MYEVQRDTASGEFLANACGTLAAQHVGRQTDLQLLERRLDPPAPAVEFDDRGRRISLVVQQRRDQADSLTLARMRTPA
jgi:hypothetical protein